MKKVISFIFCVACVHGAAHASITVNLSTRCVTNALDGCIIDDNVCYWCGTTPPPGNCKKGYAGCTSEAYIISPNGGDVLYTADGYYGYNCRSGGWTKARQDYSCKSTEYMHEGAYTCLKCPSSGIFIVNYDGTKGEERPSVVNAEHHYQGVASCCALRRPGEKYVDDTGVFDFNSDCCYSGAEPETGEPDDSDAAWCL